jgi:sugar-specific transcriptional regulator TrmB
MPPEIKALLQSIGLSDKEVAVYGAILPLGSASVRTIAEKTGINRGTVHDILENLAARGLLSFERRGARRHFFVESPDKVLGFLDERVAEIERERVHVQKVMPSLLSFYSKQGGRPTVEYFDDDDGIKRILEDILATIRLQKDKTYFAYSSKSVRNYLYRLYPTFTKDKVKLGIKTLVIALGEGVDAANLKLAERRYIQEDAPAYIIIYGSKLALISVAEDNHPFGVLIADPKIAETQKIIFKALWNKLRAKLAVS